MANNTFLIMYHILARSYYKSEKLATWLVSDYTMNSEFFIKSFGTYYLILSLFA